MKKSEVVHSCQEGTQEELNGKLGRPQTRSGHFGVEINPSHIRRVETRTVELVAFSVCRSCYPTTALTVMKKAGVNCTLLDDYAAGSRNNPEELNRHLHSGGSMKSHIKMGMLHSLSINVQLIE